jgi:hypothetical protein
LIDRSQYGALLPEAARVRARTFSDGFYPPHSLDPSYRDQISSTQIQPRSGGMTLVSEDGHRMILSSRSSRQSLYFSDEEGMYTARERSQPGQSRKSSVYASNVDHDNQPSSG